MVPDDLLLSAGARLVHIGPHKTGTTAIQDAFYYARKRLAVQDVAYFGEVAGVQHLRGAIALRQRRALMGEPQYDMSHWAQLVEDVAGASGRVVVSSEFFADVDEPAIRRVVSELGGPRVHIVVTLRPITKIMQSQWQQYVQNGLRVPYEEWLDGMLNRPPYDKPTPTFWRRHRHDRLIERWASVAGVQNVTVIVVDQSDPQMMLRTFESMVGLPHGFLIIEEATANRSLTFGEVELVRLLNEEIKRREWPEEVYARFMRRGVVRYLKTGRQPQPGEPRIITPAWAVKRAAEIGAEMAGNISALGVRIVGDISEIGRAPAGPAEMGTDAPQAVPVIPAEAASAAVLGAIIASGVPGQLAAASKPRPVADRPVREVDAKTLARVLVKRGRRRVRSALRRRR
jgi:hypothetical protein